jgi:hypothetical protein
MMSVFFGSWIRTSVGRQGKLKRWGIFFGINPGAWQLFSGVTFMWVLKQWLAPVTDIPKIPNLNGFEYGVISPVIIGLPTSLPS